MAEPLGNYEKYDGVLKQLLAEHAEELASWLLPKYQGQPCQPLPTELQKMRRHVDGAIRIGQGSSACILYIEMFSRRNPTILKDCCEYGVLLHSRYGLPIQTVILELVPCLPKEWEGQEIVYY